MMLAVAQLAPRVGLRSACQAFALSYGNAADFRQPPIDEKVAAIAAQKRKSNWGGIIDKLEFRRRRMAELRAPRGVCHWKGHRAGRLSNEWAHPSPKDMG